MLVVFVSHVLNNFSDQIFCSMCPPFNNFYQTFAPFFYASVNKALRKFSPFLDYCQLQLINCGKFSPKINFLFISLNLSLIV